MIDRAVQNRLRRLAERWKLPPDGASRLERLLVLLSKDSHAPTSITEPMRAVEVHISDSLLGLSVPQVRDAARIVDIGSGAGLPGLVLATALPAARADLVEAAQRKCSFIERAVDAMGLENVRVVPARAEEWAAGEGRCFYDAALVRAVGSLPTLVEYGAPLLAGDGVLVAWKGSRDPDEEKRGERAAALVGMQPAAVLPPPPGRERPPAGTHLHVFRQVAGCPPGFPRRPGRAQKRPLA